MASGYPSGTVEVEVGVGVRVFHPKVCMKVWGGSATCHTYLYPYSD